MAEKSGNWSREQLLVAFNLYCQTSFGKMHARNPDIIRIAEQLGRTPSALAMKLTNIASLDPAITSTGRSGLPGASKADKVMWDEMQGDWEGFALTSQAARDAIEAGAPFAAEQTAAEYAADVEDEQNYSAENRSVTTQIRIGQNFLNGKPMSALTCGASSFPAFSGMDNYKNNLRFQCLAGNGPIPVGTYYILQRESGGRPGWLRELWTGNNKKEWFALYAADGKIDDEVFCNKVKRGGIPLASKRTIGYQ